MKRIGLFFVLICAGVLAIELTLTFLRQRYINVDVRRSGTTPIEVAATPAPGAATPDAGSASTETLFIGERDAVLVDLTWDYRIGPRFPVTKVSAVIQNERGETVASDVYTIDCGTMTLSCTGASSLSLRYGQITGQNGSPGEGTWPEGLYTLSVTRSPTNEELAKRPVQVIRNQ